jgi:hypothetical protein
MDSGFAAYRPRPGMTVSHFYSAALACADEPARLAAAFFSTKRADQIEPS